MFDKTTIHFVLKQPPFRVIKRFTRIFFLKFFGNTSYIKKKQERIHPNYSPKIKNIIDYETINPQNINIDIAEFHVMSFLNHQYNILGSGWVKNDYVSEPLGFMGYRYVSQLFTKSTSTKEILSNILPATHYRKVKNKIEYLDNGYQIIDWQKDIKTGFRWNDKQIENPSQKIKGVDIKVPWEMARMHHLVQLAIFAKLIPKKKQEIVSEFKNQFWDFSIQNPVGYGVNWKCTMDVSIRAVNMLIAYDLFTQIDNDGIIDENTKKEIENSIYEHGIFIANHLEYSEIATNNHYFSNIASLLVISCYLQSSHQTNLWLLFSIQQFKKEIKKQFNPDGSTFEASTSYHRLSGEMLAISLAFLVNLPKERLLQLHNLRTKEWKRNPKIDKSRPELDLTELFEYLYKALQFSITISASDNKIVQIGDNDSGRFLKLSPVGNFISAKEAENKYENLKGYCIFSSDFEEKFWDEDILNHQPFISLCNAFFNNNPSDELLEASFIKAIIGNKTIEIPKTKNQYSTSIESPKKDLKFKKTTRHSFSRKIDLDQLSLKYFPDFGIVVIKSEKIFLSLFAGPNGQNGLGGHAHNDKLSISLFENNQWVWLDPGTAIYTSIPEMRNELRSVHSHTVPIHGKLEQDDWSIHGNGLFHLVDRHKCKFLKIEKNHLVALLKYQNIKHTREIIIWENKIIINDCSNHEFSQNFSKPDYVSNGYGQLLSSDFKHKI